MSLPPPRPEQRPTTVTFHGDERIDEYAWMRDREDPAVIAHLEAENAYTDALLAHLEPLRDELFTEFKSRIQETDEDVPYPYGDWEYYTRTVEGRQYSIYCRQPRGGGPEQILLDGNELAGHSEYFALGAYAVSPSGNLLAHSVDFDGNEKYRLQIKDLRTGDLLPDVIPETYYGTVWSADESFVFYTTVDDAHRPHELWRHRLGTDVAEDVCVYTEDDPAFYVGIGKTRSREWLVMSVHAKESSETWILRADDPEGEWRLVAPRRPAVEYELEHRGDTFYFVTNDTGPDFRVAQAPVADPRVENWTDFIPHTPGVRIEAIDAFADHLVLSYRTAGRTELDVLVGDERRRLEFDEPIYTVGLGVNREFDTSTLRIGYVSLVTPGSTIDIDLTTDERTVRKVEPVLGVDLSRYRSTREWATAADGTKVPISLVWREDREPGGPLLLYGYGSYEASMDPWFSTLRLSLLDRGVAFGVAHVRGGG
ncbi:MAG TPA: oligopeptidase B, partial [Actinopolymorphaceae bacterium]